MKNRIGEINTNKYGSEMEIVEYHSVSDVVVMFDTGNLVNTTYGQFIRGIVRNPYDQTVCEVGYLGEGIHKPSKNGKLTKVYQVWNSMLHRAYDEKYHKRQPTYKQVTVCKEWWNFQVFADWFTDNYYRIDGERMSMDKDILVKGNKIYSPETCCFVPHSINTLFVKCDNSRGSSPIGVAFNKGINKYQAQVSNNKGEISRLGYFDNPMDAFLSYKTAKESIIKDVANEFKGKIPDKLYQALMKWEVEIDD